jgi:glycosyltransferase involved in cell wall biosynthesis
LALIVPAINEENTVGRVVESLLRFGRVIVVDDGSRDATAAAAAAAGADVISHARNKGYDAALETGFARAAQIGCEYAITLDADGEHPPNIVPQFVAQLESGSDLVLGVRAELPRFSERLFSKITSRAYGIKDPFCGMKGYRMKLYLSRGWFDSYNSFGTELALHAARCRLKVDQISIPVRPRIGQPRLGSAARANYLLLRAALFGIIRR